MAAGRLPGAVSSSENTVIEDNLNEPASSQWYQPGHPISVEDGTSSASSFVQE